LQVGKEEHIVPQQPKILLAILGTRKKETAKERRTGKPRYSEMSKSGLEARAVKPEVEIFQGARPLAYRCICTNTQAHEKPGRA
jgi:hypothetical protein